MTSQIFIVKINGDRSIDKYEIAEAIRIYEENKVYSHPEIEIQEISKIIELFKEA